MMTHRKLKKLLRSKPYLLNAAFSVGEDEAGDWTDKAYIEPILGAVFS